MALQPFRPWPLFNFLILYTVDKTPWTGISPSQGRYLSTEQHKHRINAHRHPCLEWDSNPRPQCSSRRRRFMPYIINYIIITTLCHRYCSGARDFKFIFIFIHIIENMCTRWRSLLRHYATSRKVASSSPDEVDFFQLT
jgi:hypothetical protein